MLYNNHRFSVGLAFLGFGLRLCSAIFAVLTLAQIRRSMERTNRVVKSEESISTKTTTDGDESTTAANISLKNSRHHPESFTYLNKAYANDSADSGMVVYEKSDKLSSEI